MVDHKLSKTTKSKSQFLQVKVTPAMWAPLAIGHIVGSLENTG